MKASANFPDCWLPAKEPSCLTSKHCPVYQGVLPRCVPENGWRCRARQSCV